MKQWKAMFVCLVMILAVFSASGCASQVSGADTEAIQTALMGACALQGQMGSFSSPDGTTASLTEQEIQNLIDTYNADADRYISKENSVRESYKTENEQLLRDSLQQEPESGLCSVRDSGILACDIQSVETIGSDQVRADCILTTWSKVIESDLTDGEGYYVTPSTGREHIVAVLQKEDGQWKLYQTEELTILEGGFYPEAAAEAFTNLGLDPAALQAQGKTGADYTPEELLATAQTVNQMIKEAGLHPQAVQTADAILHNMEVYCTEYATITEAIQAADTLNVKEGNYFVLGSMTE